MNKEYGLNHRGVGAWGDLAAYKVSTVGGKPGAVHPRRDMVSGVTPPCRCAGLSIRLASLWPRMTGRRSADGDEG